MGEPGAPVRVFIQPQLMELLPAYLKRRDADVARLHQLIEARDFESIRQIGHKLCGNGGTFGFDGISRAGKCLETAALGQDLLKIREQTRELSEYLANLEIRPQGGG